MKINIKILAIVFLSMIIIFGLIFLNGCSFEQMGKKARDMTEAIKEAEEEIESEKAEEIAVEVIPGTLEENWKEEKGKSIESIKKESEEFTDEDAIEDIGELGVGDVIKDNTQDSNEVGKKLPDSITLKGSIWEGSELTLIVDMKTKEVKGSVYYKDNNVSYDGMIVEGKIDIVTYEINARCCGYWEDNLHPEQSADKCIDIKGKLSMDGKTVSGIAEVWTGPNPWTAKSVN